jgi:hypothetical protein
MIRLPGTFGQAEGGIALVIAPAEEGSERKAVPELRPGREVGWIFENGDAVAVERQGERIVPPARVPGPRDE